MTTIVMHEYHVPTADAGIVLYARNKHPAGTTEFSPGRTVLFVHGSTYPAETAFDLALGGTSWMDVIAVRGFDVWMLDVRGYGQSTRPAEMDGPAAANPPFADTATARRDVDTVLGLICRLRNIPRVVLLGWSWGCAIMGSYATLHPANVEKLILYAPGWLRDAPSPVDQGGELGAWRGVTRAQAQARWLYGVPERHRDSLIPDGWFDAWADATFATDPVGAAMNPPVLRAPNGTTKDSREFWAAGKPLYDPAHITAPTLIIVGEWDRDTPPAMALAIFALLANARHKRVVVLGQATHTALMERERHVLFDEVQLFLEGSLA